MKNTNTENPSRRKLLKQLAVTGGVAYIASDLPTKWTRPVVEAVVLPAHAQTSVLCDFSGDYNGGAATLSVSNNSVSGVWNTNNRPDFFGTLSDGGCRVLMTFPDDGQYGGTLEGCRIQWSFVNNPNVVDPNNVWSKDNCA